MSTGYEYITIYIEKLRYNKSNNWWISSEAIAFIDSPQFENTGRVHNWRNYIDDDLKPIWDKLPIEFRAYLIYQSMKQASLEEWD